MTMIRKQTDYTQRSVVKKDGEKAYQTESSWEIALSNGQSKAITAKVIEPLPENAKVISENYSHKKEDASIAVWHVPVPAKGKAVLKYKVRVN